MTSADTHFDVAIVGYGPTGATLALLLAQSGLRVVVFDREDDIYNLPRAVHFDDETMRIFQWAGVSEAVSQKVIVNKGMQFVDAAGTLLLDWPRPQTLTSHGWHASYRFHQPDLERALRAKLGDRHGVTVRTGTARGRL